MKGTIKQIPIAKKLRKEQTDAEKLLWYKLRNKQLNGIKFRRQDPVGPFIVDFITYDKNIIIELDGGQHNNDENKIKDTQRTIFLQKKGFTVLRFWNNDIFENLDEVLEGIRKEF